MPTIDGKLKAGERQMTEEEWALNKDCTAKSREHKWRWEFISSGESAGRVSPTNAVCVHCGKRVKLSRRALEYVDDPT